LLSVDIQAALQASNHIYSLFPISYLSATKESQRTSNHISGNPHHALKHDSVKLKHGFSREIQFTWPNSRKYFGSVKVNANHSFIRDLEISGDHFGVVTVLHQGFLNLLQAVEAFPGKLLCESVRLEAVRVR
jgi:hypothetical protein